jgi:superfamily II DNA/RNA helicase
VKPPGRRRRPSDRSPRPRGRSANRPSSRSGRAGGSPAPAPRSAHRASAAPFVRPQDDPWKFLPRGPREAIARLGFARPTPIQAAALPPALEGRSFRALAPTGTGKTLIYLLAAWRVLSGGKAKALILVPTRELAYQVTEMLRDLEPTLGEVSALAIGGHPKEAQLRRLRQGWRILVATPGRLLEMLDEGSIALREAALCVLDEFDKLVGMGFADQIAAVLRRVPADAQRLLLSATPAEPEAPSGGDPEKGASAAAAVLGLESLPLIAVDREAGSRVMEEAFYLLKSDRKKAELLLSELAQARGQAIVFVGNREKANHLNGLLRLKGIGCRALHGHLAQAERADAYAAFLRGGFRVLVATDLAARGLDMPEVDLIVNYDLPKHYKDYVHRTGRAARRGRAGRCASFAGPGEYIPMRNLEREFPGPMPLHPAFANREAWFRDAKRSHDHKVALAERAERIRREQGLDEETGPEDKPIP